MHRQRIAAGRRARTGADLLHIVGPSDREGLCSPHLFEQGPIGPLRGAIDGAGDVGEPHFHRVGRRPLRLLRGRVAQSAAGGPHVPEVAADEIALTGIVMQDGRERRIGVRLRLAVAKSRAHRPGIGARGAVEL
jgi:hypothetical protein